MALRNWHHNSKVAEQIYTERKSNNVLTILHGHSEVIICCCTVTRLNLDDFLKQMYTDVHWPTTSKGHSPCRSRAYEDPCVLQMEAFICRCTNIFVVSTKWRSEILARSTDAASRRQILNCQEFILQNNVSQWCTSTCTAHKERCVYLRQQITGQLMMGTCISMDHSLSSLVHAATSAVNNTCVKVFNHRLSVALFR